MARSIIFVNDSGLPWTLTGFGGIVVPATGIYNATEVLSDDELTSAIQKGLASEFDTEHYLRINGVDLSAEGSASFVSSPHAVTHDIGGVDPTTSGLSTGILYGGNLTINGTDPTKFDITAGAGIIVDSYTDPKNPTMVFVEWGDQVGVPDPHIADDTETYISIDSGGNFVFATVEPNCIDRRTNIYVGWTSHPDLTEIFDAYTEPPFAADAINQFEDFLAVFGAFNIDGNVYGAQANLRIKRSFGRTFDNDSNFRNNPKSPHVLSTSPESPVAKIWYFYRDPAELNGWKNDLPFVMDIDPDNYDDGSGTLAPVPTGKFTIQVITFYAPWGVTDIQYGQAVYDTMADAFAHLEDPSVVMNPWNAQWDTLRCWLIVQEGTTDLTDVAKAKFVQISRFGGIQSGSSGTNGEANTASNQGLSGIGLFLSKVGVDLGFKNIRAASAKITVANNGGQKTVDVDLGPHAHDGVDGSGTVAHSATTGQTANDHHNRQHALTSVSDHTGSIDDTQHGNRGGGSLHPFVTPDPAGVAGFMSSADKSKIDGLPSSAVPTTRQVIAGAGLTGGGDLSADRTLDVVANADGSIVVNANDIQVGVLATDAQHGTRGGGTQHPAATGAVNGFMSSADKTKLNSLVALANSIAEANDNITTTSAIPVLATGMTLTPVAGTYLCFFQGSIYQDTTGPNLYVETCIYAAGALLTHSRVRPADGASYQDPFHCAGIAVVNGSQAIEGRWSRPAGAGTAYMRGPRALIIVRIA